MSNKIAAFDVDGTLTFTDSFTLFLRYVAGREGYFLKMASLTPVFITYALKIISRDEAKNHLISKFFKDMDYQQYIEKCHDFAKNAYPLIVRKDGLEAVANHIKNNENPIIVSASLEDYLKPWGESIGMKTVLATRLEVKGGKLTGQMLGKNCRAEEKLARIRELYPNAEIVAAYGDSRGDKEMLEAATKPYYRFLKDEPKNASEVKRGLYLGNLL